MKEADLYPAIKQFLEGQGYDTKGEVANCDVVAVRGDEPPLIVELKLSLNLSVLLQAVERLSISPNVYVGVPRGCGVLQRKPRQVRKLIRLLGIGLMVIDPGNDRHGVRVVTDPGEYRPRQTSPRKTRLLGEFEKRVGDPNAGGAESRSGIMTAYRQNALRLAMFLQRNGPTKASDVVKATDIDKAREILYRDVYGWFDRVARGTYTLSPRGKREFPSWPAPDLPE